MAEKWTTITISKSTKDDLSRLKEDKDTWDDVFARLIAAVDSEYSPDESEQFSSVLQELQEIHTTLDQVAESGPESHPETLSKGVIDDFENGAYRGAKRAIEEFR